MIPIRYVTCIYSILSRDGHLHFANTFIASAGRNTMRLRLARITDIQLGRAWTASFADESNSYVNVIDTHRLANAMMNCYRTHNVSDIF